MRRTVRRAAAIRAPAAAIFAVIAAAGAAGDPAVEPRPYTIVDGSIATPLTAVSGDPARGRAIVVDRQGGLCLLCHSGPFPEQHFQGDLAPDLTGTGARWSEGELRARIVDPRALNPATIMPRYFAPEGLTRVAPGFRGRTILTAGQIEDVVAYLVTLK